MASVGTFEALVFVLVASSLVVASNGWCSNSSGCNTGYVCCNNNCFYGTDCSGQCTSDSDCSSYESCCSSTCKAGSDCIGFSCSTDYDCDSSGGVEYCCYGMCSYNSDCYNYDPTGVIVGSIFGVMIFICLVSLCIFYAYRRRQTRPGRVIVGQRVTAATVTTTGHVTQANQPYQGQMPPYGQQGYPYHPPPQYEQHQTAIPPPYSSGTTAASDQPPPYNAATQGRSGGVYSPQTSYGAVQPPSGPPKTE